MMLNRLNNSVNITKEALGALQNKYLHIHPVLFLRSVERAQNEIELDLILDSMPNLPVIWNETDRRWTRTDLSMFNV